MAKYKQIKSYLNELFPNASCALNFKTPYELLIAVMLSAQCTDKRVNIVTNDLFKIANTPQKMLQLGEKRLKEIIYPCGFYNAKSKAILKTSSDLINKFDGKVPDNLEDLTSLQGVGRKTANVVIANAFGGQTIAVDTHVHRISKRLGLTDQNSTAFECEMDLLKIVPYEERSKTHHQMILFGREVCKAIHPNCEICKLKNICLYFKQHSNNKTKQISKQKNKQDKQ